MRYVAGSRTTENEVGDRFQHPPSQGRSKRPSSKAAGEAKPETYPLGYVEDIFEARTKLEAFFSILSHKRGQRGVRNGMTD
ncbi:MAG: hypothetical protein ACXWWE_09700, partial [Nitrospira sp.]